VSCTRRAHDSSLDLGACRLSCAHGCARQAQAVESRLQIRCTCFEPEICQTAPVSSPSSHRPMSMTSHAHLVSLWRPKTHFWCGHRSSQSIAVAQLKAFFKPVFMNSTHTLTECRRMTASSANSRAADWRACWAMAGMFALGLQLRGMCCSSLANTSLNLQPHHLLLQHPCTDASVKLTYVDLHCEYLQHIPCSFPSSV